MSTLITITYNSNDTLKYTSEDLINKKKVKLSNIRTINVYSHNLNLNEINDDADKTDIILPKVIIKKESTQVDSNYLIFSFYLLPLRVHKQFLLPSFRL